MFAELQQTPRLKKLQSFLPPPRLTVGDAVHLPDGQQAVIRYIGSISNKDGEFAGIELMEEWANQGFHSGEYDGVRYFQTTNGPKSGLFIPYLKLLNSQQQQQQQQPQQQHSTSPRRKQSRIPLSPAVQKVSTAAAPMLSTGSPARTFSGGSADSAGNESVIFRPADNNIGATISSSAALRAQTESQREIVELRNELERYKIEIEERDQAFEVQSQVLKDLELAVAEFETLKEQEEKEMQLGRGFNEEAEELKRQLDDKERKISRLRSQLEEKRAEFREAMDDIQREMEESSASYTEEIKLLQTRLMELESQSLTKQSSNRDSHPSSLTAIDLIQEQEKAQISRLADIENKLLEKDEQIEDLKKQMERAQELLDDALKSLEDTETARAEAVKEAEAAKSAAEKIQSETVKQLEALRAESKKEPQFISPATTTDQSEEIAKLKELLTVERSKYESEISNLESLLEAKIFREEELEQEIEMLKLSGSTPKMSSYRNTKNAHNIDDELIAVKDINITDDSESSLDDHLDSRRSKDHSEAVAMDDESDEKLDMAAGRPKWCALCERHGHESIECVYEE